MRIIQYVFGSISMVFMGLGWIFAIPAIYIKNKKRGD